MARCWEESATSAMPGHLPMSRVSRSTRRRWRLGSGCCSLRVCGDAWQGLGAGPVRPCGLRLIEPAKPVDRLRDARLSVVSAESGTDLWRNRAAVRAIVRFLKTAPDQTLLKVAPPGDRDAKPIPRVSPIERPKCSASLR